MPGAEQIVILIRIALLTLNDALRTGNFTVLRDIGAPGFREANTAAKLSDTFASLRVQGVDLSPVAVVTPEITAVPTLETNNMLHLKGYFPVGKVHLNFEMLYEPVDGQWRLFGLGVSVVPGSTGPAPKAAPAAPKKGGEGKRP
jgi:hypothetical protein